VARINSLWRTNKRLSRDGVQPLLSAFKRAGFTDEELQPAFFASPKKSRGGQPDNSNNLINGLRASAFSPAESQRLAREPDHSVQSELNLLRVQVLRAAISMRTAEGLDVAQRLRALRIFTLANTIIEKLERRKLSSFSTPSRLDDLIDRLLRTEGPEAAVNAGEGGSPGQAISDSLAEPGK